MRRETHTSKEVNMNTDTNGTAQKPFDDEAAARSYRPRLSLYHANGKVTGRAPSYLSP